MKVLSIDIETTGLDPDFCQVIEIGAIYADVTPEAYKVLGSFETCVRHAQIIGDAYALWMNVDILKLISDQTFPVTVENAGSEFAKWLSGVTDDKKVTVIGKNAAMFDLRFLRLLPGFPIHMVRHRVLDLGSMFLQVDDEVPPDLETCAARAGLEIIGIKHRALADADTVLRCFFRKMSKLPRS